MPAARVEYIAPWWVVWLHSVPHLGLRLQPVDSTFRPRDESYQEVSPRPGAPSPRTALSRLPARLAPRASRPHTPPTPHSLRSLFPRRPFPRVLGPQPSRLGTSRAWTTGKMGVKPVNGTGGRALPAGRGLGLSAQGEGSAAQGSGLGVHWYLNPVILARQLRGAGAGRRGAPRGFSPPAGNQTRSRFPGLCDLGEVWAETNWSLRVRPRGSPPPQPLPAPPPGPLLEGDRPRGEGRGPAASCG